MELASSSPIVSSLPPSPARLAELRRAFGTLLASRLAAAELGPVVLEAPSPEAAEGLAREQGARSLVRLTLAVEDGRAARARRSCWAPG